MAGSAAGAGAGTARPRLVRRGGIGGGDHDLLWRGEAGAADAHAVFAALHFQFRDPGFAGQGDQFSDFIDCHQWISLTDSSGTGAMPRAPDVSLFREQFL